MKNLIYVSIITLFGAACGSPGEKEAALHLTLSTNQVLVDSFFIPVDTAQRMEQSYIASYGVPYPEDTLSAWTINAEALRAYLKDTNIKEINIALAHTLSYINSGNYGVPSGFSARALTIVLKGQSTDGGAIYYQENYAMNRAKPCPPICLTNTTLFPSGQ